nr:MAG TPA: hypothetical protein [Caudoviricetes sp.]
MNIIKKTMKKNIMNFVLIALMSVSNHIEVKLYLVN